MLIAICDFSNIFTGIKKETQDCLFLGGKNTRRAVIVIGHPFSLKIPHSLLLSHSVFSFFPFHFSLVLNLFERIICALKKHQFFALWKENISARSNVKTDHFSPRVLALDALNIGIKTHRHDNWKWLLVLMQQNKEVHIFCLGSKSVGSTFQSGGQGQGSQAAGQSGLLFSLDSSALSVLWEDAGGTLEKKGIRETKPNKYSCIIAVNLLEKGLFKFAFLDFLSYIFE